MATNLVTIDTIIGMINASHKDLQPDLIEIGNWCGECIEEIGEYTAMDAHYMQPFHVKQNRCQLPCNVLRVLKVHFPHHIDCNHEHGKYHVQYPYIIFRHYNGPIHLDYISIPMDEKELPLIDQKARQACYYYCIMKMKEEDYQNGKVPERAWNDMKLTYEYYADRARGNMGNMTRDDLNGITRLLTSMLRRVELPGNMM